MKIIYENIIQNILRTAESKIEVDIKKLFDLLKGHKVAEDILIKINNKATYESLKGDISKFKTYQPTNAKKLEKYFTQTKVVITKTDIEKMFESIQKMADILKKQLDKNIEFYEREN